MLVAASTVHWRVLLAGGDHTVSKRRTMALVKATDSRSVSVPRNFLGLKGDLFRKFQILKCGHIHRVGKRVSPTSLIDIVQTGRGYGVPDGLKCNDNRRKRRKRIGDPTGIRTPVTNKHVVICSCIEFLMWLNIIDISECCDFSCDWLRYESLGLFAAIT